MLQLNRVNNASCVPPLSVLVRDCLVMSAILTAVVPSSKLRSLDATIIQTVITFPSGCYLLCKQSVISPADGPRTIAQRLCGVEEPPASDSTTRRNVSPASFLFFTCREVNASYSNWSSEPFSWCWNIKERPTNPSPLCGTTVTA